MTKEEATEIKLGINALSSFILSAVMPQLCALRATVDHMAETPTLPPEEEKPHAHR